MALWLLLPAAGAQCSDWPQWRGPQRNGVSEDVGLLDSWPSQGPAEAWHASDLGEGYSSLAIAQGVVFTTGRIDKNVFCFALDSASGQRIWATKVGTTSRNVMSTPTVHAGLVYALDPDGELVCLDATDGRIIWQRSFLGDFSGRMMSGRGYAESPLIDGDRLICTPGGADAMLVALDRRTGHILWKSSIPQLGPKGADGAGFSSPVLSQGAGVRQYVQLTGRGLVGVEAETGRFLWGYNDLANETANIPTPLVRGDLVFAANGYHAGSVLLRLDRTDGGSGVTAQEVYRIKGTRFQNHHGGIVLMGDHVYGGHGSNNGLPTCVDFQTGKIAWKRRGPGTGSAAVVAADGHLYLRFQDGVVALIEATPSTYRLKGTFKLPGAAGDSWSHPVVAHGKLFLREKSRLWVYNVRAGASGATGLDRALIPRAPGSAELIRLGATIESLDAKDTAGATHRLYRVALRASRRPDAALLITLTNRHVTGEGNVSEAIVSMLRRLTAPLIVSLAGTRVDDDGIRSLTSLESLAGLNLELCRQITDQSLKPLQDAERLGVLVLAGTSVSHRGLRVASNVPNLTALDLEFCDSVTDQACDVLRSMTTLRALNLNKAGFEPIRITDRGLAALADLSDLEVLRVAGNLITDNGLGSLRRMRRLRELDLSRLALTDRGLRSLMPLENLQRLDLVYSEGFAGPLITDAGMKHLGNLGRLQSLNLVGAPIGDDALPDLMRLDRLRHLKVVGSRISPDGLQRLQRRLPDCRVIH